MHTPRLLAVVVGLLLPAALFAQPLPGTQPLKTEGDLAKQMVEGIDRYLTRRTQELAKQRTASWKPDYSSAAAYTKSLEPQRQRLRKILGVVDERVPVTMEYVATTDRPALLAKTDRYAVYAVRWPVLPGVHGEGLLLEPAGKAKACVVALPDAGQTPEMLVGLTPGVEPQSQFARVLAEHGVRVVVPTLVDRNDTWSGSERVNRYTNQTHREFVYRMAFEMGRHLIGYEVQKVLAAVDWFAKDKDHPPIGVYGYGEGGLLAFYSAAVDPRIDSTVVSGYFGPRENLHDEPLYRNVWSLLRDFGDAEIARLIAPRSLVIEASALKTSEPPAPRDGRRGAAPGSITSPSHDETLAEYRRIFQLPGGADKGLFKVALSEPNGDRFGRPATNRAFLKGLNAELNEPFKSDPPALPLNDPAPRQKRQFDELVNYTQNLLGPSKQRRHETVWSRLDTKSPAALKKSQQPVRDYFWEQVIGKLPASTLPMNPRTRLIYDEPKWKGYEVVLDLYEDVICYGILLVPNDLKPGEQRPVVVCQHGLEGRPTQVVNPKEKTPYYHSFGAQLADRGYVVFAPQNPYIFENQFRQFVRKANAQGLTIYSFIVRQHERILDWLATLPFVDADRIAFYGLSYGGKVAMRIPAILTRYCLSICSGDFNEWIWKNINLEWPGSYMLTKEYEMYEFDLGNTFNYAEMAALIAPRPFMVERGHSDGVGLDEYVAYEYAKVRRLYAQAGLADRTAIEFFVGGHVINGQGTFAFLDRHLKR